MWFLLAFSYGNSDYASYENQFRYYNVVNRNWSISNDCYQGEHFNSDIRSILLITNDFMRFFRSISILNYALLINAFYIQKNKIDYKVSLRRLPVSYGLLLLDAAFATFSNYYYIAHLYWDSVVLPLFQNNLLIP